MADGSLLGEVVFRPALRGEVDAIARLLADDGLGAGREDAGASEGYMRAFDAIERDPRNVLIVAVMMQGDGSQRIVGCMQLTSIPQMTFGGGMRMQIEGVRVDGTLRGRGIGGEMMRWAIDHARSQGCHLVQLTSNVQRTKARRFYERLGFEPSHVGFKMYLQPDPRMSQPDPRPFGG